MQRVTLGRMQHPVRGFLHGGAALASLVGMAFLVAHAWGEVSRVVGAVVFGCSLLAMYVVSALYHSVPWRARVKRALQRVDHSMIFVLVAGTVTPVAIASLEGGVLVAALAGVWGMAAAGIVLKLVSREPRTWLSITIQMVMGYSAVLWLPVLHSRHGWAATGLILGGGIAYTVGMVFFATKWPRLAPRVYSSHELFHTFVVAASGLHFAAVWQVL